MADVVFVFSNPRHHLEMMAPVAEELSRRGVRTALVSLAELRGFQTPASSGARRVIPLQLRRRAAGGPPPAGSSSRSSSRASSGGASSTSSSGSGASWRRGRLAQRLVWRLALSPRLRWLLRGARVVVVPNDAVYPYTELVEQLRAAGVATVLMQEGIRFQQPESYTGPRYGSAVTGAICAWGEGSRDFFLAGKVPAPRIAVTGAPRFDGLDVAAWRAQGEALRIERKLAAPPLAFLSNPIEYQGYGDRAHKLSLFAQFLAGAAPVVRAAGLPIVVKNHLHEDPADYARVAAASPIADLVTVVADAPIFAVIAASRAAVVFTSTVGLEALCFGLSLGVLEIPGHPFAFDYVQRGAAAPIRIASVTADVTALLAADDARAAAGQRFVERHLHDRGRARHNVADVIERVLAGAPVGGATHPDAKR